MSAFMSVWRRLLLIRLSSYPLVIARAAEAIQSDADRLEGASAAVAWNEQDGLLCAPSDRHRCQRSCLYGDGCYSSGSLRTPLSLRGPPKQSRATRTGLKV